MSREKSDKGVSIVGGTVNRIGKGAVGIRITNCGPVTMRDVDIDEIQGQGVVIETSDHSAKPSGGIAKGLVTGVISAGIAKALGL